MPTNGTVYLNHEIFTGSTPATGFMINKNLSDNTYSIPGNLNASTLRVDGDNTLVTISGDVNLADFCDALPNQNCSSLLACDRLSTISIAGSLVCDGKQSEHFIFVFGNLSALNITMQNCYSGVTINGTMTTPGNITMSNNQSDDSSLPAVRIRADAVETNGTFTIDVKDNVLQKFDSSAVAIKKVGGEANLNFSDFDIKVGEVTQSSYPTLNNRVVLNEENQL